MMSYKKYGVLFTAIIIAILIFYYLDYIYSNTIYLYGVICLGIGLIIFNIFYLRKVKLKDGFSFSGFSLYNLDKLIVGLLVFITLFIIDISIPKNNIYIISYSIFALCFFSSIRILKNESNTKIT